MNTERRVSIDGQIVAVVDSRGNALDPSNVDEYLNSVGMPAEYRTRAKMSILGHKTDLPITVDGKEQRSSGPTDESSPDFDAQEWLTLALKRSARIAEELSAPVEESRSLLFDND